MYVLSLFDSCFRTTRLPAGRHVLSGQIHADLVACLDDCQSEQITFEHDPTHAMAGSGCKELTTWSCTASDLLPAPHKGFRAVPTLEDDASLALGNSPLEPPVGSVVYHAQQVKDINLSLLLLCEDVLWQFACTRRLMHSNLTCKKSSRQAAVRNVTVRVNTTECKRVFHWAARLPYKVAAFKAYEHIVAQ